VEFATLYPFDATRLVVTDGTGSAIVFACPAGASPCNSPSGETSKLTFTGAGSLRVYVRAYRDSSRVWFSSTGRADSTADAFGNKIRFVYDASNRLTRVTDPVRTFGGTPTYITLSYTSTGLASIRDPNPTTGDPSSGGRVTNVVVASDSTLQTWTDPDGVATQLRYDGSRRLERIINRRGDTTQLVYHATFWKLSQIIMPRVDIATANGTTTIAAPTVNYRPWQIVGVPTTTTGTTAATWALLDTATARLTDPGSHTSTFTADYWGQPLRVVDALGNVTTITRDGMFASQINYPTGAIDRYTYSGTTFLQSSQLAGQDATNYTYDSYGHLKQVSGNKQATVIYFRNSIGRTDSVSTAGMVTRYVYNSSGQPTVVTDPLNHVVNTSYDATFGNVNSTVAPGQRTSNRRVDGFGRDSVLSANLGVSRQVLYDLVNRVTRDSVVGQAQPVKYSYDQQYLVRVSDAKGQVFRRSVNALGWVTRAFDPADTLNRSISYRYTLDGQLASYTNRRGQRVDLQYDVGHRLTIKNGPANVQPDSFFYNALGTVVVGRNAVAYDSIFTNAATGWTDSVVTGVASHRYSEIYVPTSVHQLDSIRFTTNSGITFARRRYIWNASDEQLDHVWVNGSLAVDLLRNSEGLESSRSWLPGPSAQRTMTYSANHLTQTASYSAGPINDAFYRGYGLDSLMRVKEVDKYGPSSNMDVRADSFDTQGRLVRLKYALVSQTTCNGNSLLIDNGWTCGGANVAATGVLLFKYDAASNLIQHRDSIAAVSDTGIYSVGNRISRMGTATFGAPDLDGNVTSRTVGGVTTTFTWSADNRLTQVVQGATTLDYVYDAFGRLVVRRRNGTAERTFLWDGDQLLAELNGTGTQRVAEYVYYPGVDQPLGLVTGATAITRVRYFHQDMLGNVMGIADGTTVAQQIDYEPWGAVRGSIPGTVADTNRLRWKGLVWEGDITQLYYVRARWYDPSARSFVSEDPIGVAGGLNEYSFAGNDPINGRDPLGLSPQCVIWLAENGGIVRSGYPGMGGIEQRTPAKYDIICWNDSSDQVIGLDGWPAGHFKGDRGPTIGSPPPGLAKVHLTKDPACYEAGAYVLGSALIDLKVGGEVFGGLKLTVAGFWKWTKSLFNFGSIDWRARYRAWLVGQEMVADGAPTVIEHATDDFNRGAIYQEASGWSVAGAIVPGITTGLAAIEAYDICHPGAE